MTTETTLAKGESPEATPDTPDVPDVPGWQEVGRYEDIRFEAA